MEKTDIPPQNISNLSEKVQKHFDEINTIIGAYRFKPNHSMTIELWAPAYDAINRELKKKMKAELSHRTYRGYSFARKEKRKRYSKKNILEAFEF